MKRIEKARSEGAEQVLGGQPQGLVVPPHVFVNVTNDMSVARGTVRARGGDHQGARRGRGGGGRERDRVRPVGRGRHARRRARQLQFAQRIQAGMTHVNDSPVNDLPNCPFGGEKNSGLGRYNGEWVDRGDDDGAVDQRAARADRVPVLIKEETTVAMRNGVTTAPDSE